MAHLTVSDSLYLRWLKIVLISETPGRFGGGSGVPCVLQEGALRAGSHAAIRDILPWICAIPAVLPGQDLGGTVVGVSSMH